MVSSRALKKGVRQSFTRQGIALAPGLQTCDVLKGQAALFTSQANWSRFDSKHECCEKGSDPLVVCGQPSDDIDERPMLIKELQDLQRQHGYRPREALHDLTERLNSYLGQKNLASREKRWPRRIHANCSGHLGRP